MATTRMRLRLSRGVVLAAVLVLVTAGALWWIFGGDGAKRVTAYFDRTVGVYEGSDVRMLGVAIGTVESVTPKGERVEVILSVEADAPVAATTGAVVVAPSVVADRYVQFTTLSRGGPSISDGAVISSEHTKVPIELDELYRSLNQLASALGPKGANRDGALSELLRTGAANLEGNGAVMNDTIRDFADLARTLSGSKEDLFGTVRELQTFTTMLATNDDEVASLNEKLASVSKTLADDRQELSAALNGLGGALADIKTFIEDNRSAIKANVDKLASTTQQLVDNRASVAEALDVAPLAAQNLLRTYDPASGSMQVRTDILEYFLNPGGGGSAGKATSPLPLPALTAPSMGGGR